MSEAAAIPRARSRRRPPKPPCLTLLGFLAMGLLMLTATWVTQ